MGGPQEIWLRYTKVCSDDLSKESQCQGSISIFEDTTSHKVTFREIECEGVDEVYLFGSLCYPCGRDYEPSGTVNS